MTPKKKFQWSRGDDGEGGETHYTERASRGEAARANDRIFRLGKALVEIDTARLDALTLSDDIRDALDEARRLRARGGVRSAMRRQLLFISGVLRKQDAEVLDALQRAVGP